MIIEYYIKTSWQLQTKKLQQIYTQNKKKKKPKSNTKDSPQVTREQNTNVRKKTCKNKSKNNKTAIKTHISITSFDENELNTPTKRHRMTKWIQKQNRYICCQQETHFKSWKTYGMKVRGKGIS